MVAILVNLLAALGIPKADFIGFSIGGGIVQYLAYTYPQLVNKLILAGTQSGIGPGVVLPPREVLESAGVNNDQTPTEEDMMKLFFYPSGTSLALGHGRGSVTAHRDFKFTTDTSTFDWLTDIKAPVLVTNGHTEIMSPTSNSFVLQQEIPNAQLHLYPDAGHGHLFQVPELYAKYH
ncbi:Alpha/Beta hydrolase protein [Aspergillus fruticulosus]